MGFSEVAAAEIFEAVAADAAVEEGAAVVGSEVAGDVVAGEVAGDVVAGDVAGDIAGGEVAGDLAAGGAAAETSAEAAAAGVFDAASTAGAPVDAAAAASGAAAPSVAAAAPSVAAPVSGAVADPLAAASLQTASTDVLSGAGTLADPLAAPTTQLGTLTSAAPLGEAPTAAVDPLATTQTAAGTADALATTGDALPAASAAPAPAEEGATALQAADTSGLPSTQAAPGVAGEGATPPPAEPSGVPVNLATGAEDASLPGPPTARPDESMIESIIGRGNAGLATSLIKSPAVTLGLPLANVAGQVIQGEPPVPQATKRLADGTVTQLEGVAQTELAQGQSGELSPGQAASIANYRNNAVNALIQSLVQQGVTNPTSDSRYIAGLQAIDQNVAAQSAGFIETSLKDGMAAAGIVSQDLLAEAQQQIQQDQQYQAALASAMQSFGLVAGLTALGSKS